MLGATECDLLALLTIKFLFVLKLLFVLKDFILSTDGALIF